MRKASDGIISRIVPDIGKAAREADPWFFTCVARSRGALWRSTHASARRKTGLWKGERGGCAWPESHGPAAGPTIIESLTRPTTLFSWRTARHDRERAKEEARRARRAPTLHSPDAQRTPRLCSPWHTHEPPLPAGVPPAVRLKTQFANPLATRLDGRY